jgi:hypothetical protein
MNNPTVLAVALAIGIAALSVGVSAAQDAPPAAPAALDLVCDGMGTIQESRSTTADVYTSQGGSAFGSATTSGKARIPAQVQFEMKGQSGRIHFPKSLVPAINGGGVDGWWPVTDLVIGDTEITGRFRLNFLNKPSIRIDRVNGSVEIQGFARLGFEGKCAREDRTQRAF